MFALPAVPPPEEPLPFELHAASSKAPTTNEQRQVVVREKAEVTDASRAFIDARRRKPRASSA
jgi:hypothetical protein